MTEKQIIELTRLGESATVEYKTCAATVSNSLYESVCSFLNRNGGWILLGVHDDGEIVGVEPDRVNTLQKDIVNTLNNPEAFLPKPYVEPEVVSVEGKTIIALNVPAGQYVYRLNGRYWDRNGDADVDVTDSPERLLMLFERKNPHIFEEREIMGMKMGDIDTDTMRICRRIVSVNHSNHAWLKLDDKELLLSAHLATEANGELHFKYAALLLFGTDEAIERLMPHYRFEAIYRKCTYRQYEAMDDVANRYDDRQTLRCNLLKVYDKLMQFAEKYMPDKFYLPNGSEQRMDLRHQLLREIVGNLCVHPDYSSGYACFLEIYRDYLITRNPSRLIPQSPEGSISINQLGNYTKNPLLVKVFREMDWAEDLGSGTRNILKYAPIYYTDYKIGIDNGQNFLFAISFATDGENVGENDRQVDGEKNGNNVGEKGCCKNNSNNDLEQKYTLVDDRQDDGKNVGVNHEMTVRNGGVPFENDGEKHKMTVKDVDRKNWIEKGQQKRRNKIIGLIKQNPYVTQKQLAVSMNVGLKTVERDMKWLQDRGVIRYDGQWRLLK